MKDIGDTGYFPGGRSSLGFSVLSLLHGCLSLLARLAKCLLILEGPPEHLLLWTHPWSSDHPLLGPRGPHSWCEST